MGSRQSIVKNVQLEFPGLTPRQIRGKMISLGCTMKGITHEQLAETIHITRGQMVRIISGKCAIDCDRMEEIASALEQPLDFFRANS